MTTTLWILLAIALLFVLIYVLNTRRLIRESREAEKHVDPNKIRPWKDED